MGECGAEGCQTASRRRIRAENPEARQGDTLATQHRCFRKLKSGLRFHGDPVAWLSPRCPARAAARGKSSGKRLTAPRAGWIPNLFHATPPSSSKSGEQLSGRRHREGKYQQTGVGWRLERTSVVRAPIGDPRHLRITTANNSPTCPSGWPNAKTEGAQRFPSAPLSPFRWTTNDGIITRQRLTNPTPNCGTHWPAAPETTMEIDHEFCKNDGPQGETWFRCRQELFRPRHRRQRPER